MKEFSPHLSRAVNVHLPKGYASRFLTRQDPQFPDRVVAAALSQVLACHGLFFPCV